MWLECRRERPPGEETRQVQQGQRLWVSVYPENQDVAHRGVLSEGVT